VLARLLQCLGLLVLGLDPGSQHTGWAFVERRGSTLVALDFGRISCARQAPLQDRLAHLTLELRGLLTARRPDRAALETPFHGPSVRSLIVLAQARGALLSVLGEAGVETAELSPAEVKVAVTGSGRADKTQVARMVRLLLALSLEPLAKDTTDALAVAICCVQRQRLDAWRDAAR
jgi:crossover junction endodeoxyribonuclease RuvC